MSYVEAVQVLMSSSSGAKVPSRVMFAVGVTLHDRHAVAPVPGERDNVLNHRLALKRSQASYLRRRYHRPDHRCRQKSIAINFVASVVDQVVRDR